MDLLKKQTEPNYTIVPMMMEEILKLRPIHDVFAPVVSQVISCVDDPNQGVNHCNGKTVMEIITGMDNARENVLIDLAKEMNAPFLFNATDCHVVSIQILDMDIIFVEGHINIRYDSGANLNGITIFKKSPLVLMDPISERDKPVVKYRQLVLIDKDMVKTSDHRFHVIIHELTHVILSYFVRKYGLFSKIGVDQLGEDFTARCENDYSIGMANEYIADVLWLFLMSYDNPSTFNLDNIILSIEKMVYPLLVPSLLDIYKRYADKLKSYEDELINSVEIAFEV